MSKSFIRYFLFSVILTAGLSALGIYKLHLHVLVAYFFSINAVTFVLYGFDKFIASRDFLRVSENTLHLLALFGGSLAALAGQQVFWHKVNKRSFQVVYWLIIIAQTTLLYLIFFTDFLKAIF